MVRWVVVAAMASTAAGCARPVKTARLTTEEPPTALELEAEKRVHNRSCSHNWSFLYPGLGHQCLGLRTDAIGFATVATAELGGAGIAAYQISESDAGTVDEVGDTAAGTSLALLAVAFQDLYLYNLADAAFWVQRSNRMRFVPHDEPLDLVAAPFNLEVLKRPSVWGGLLGVLTVGLGVTWLVSDIDFDRVGDDPVVFGETRDGRWAYPAMFGVGTGLFSHVAVAEEAVFRGYVQSGLARSFGEVPGWIVGSMIFGAVHALNLPQIPEDERDEYIIYGLPTITAIGAYLGWQYIHEDYSLAPSTAVHFWYDLLLSAALFAVEPDTSPVSANIRFGW